MIEVIDVANEGKMPRRSAEQPEGSEGPLNIGQAVDPKAKLRPLPPLDSQTAALRPIPCKVCGAHSIPFDRVDFNKYCSAENFYEFGFSGVTVDYFRCVNCGFLFTTLCDDWSADDFHELIYNDDYIKVDGEYAETRPARVASVIAERFRGAEDARILDYGSGAGVFVQLMREAGFRNIAAFDPFSSPARPHGRFDIITCFEVIEHTPDPRSTLADILTFLKPEGSILLSQTLQPDNILSAKGTWWYLAPRNGHLSTFTEEALELLGRERGLLFYSGDTIYGFAGPSPNRYAQIALSSIGPSFSTLKLFAPSTMPGSAIVFPGGDRVVWHRTEKLGVSQFRWTGSYRTLQWSAKWSPVASLRIHIPMTQEAAADFGARCILSLDGIEKPVTLVRGDMTAAFEVIGKTRGSIELHTPEPVKLASAAGRAVGIAIPTAWDRTSTSPNARPLGPRA